jgi:hypothetical protein
VRAQAARTCAPAYDTSCCAALEQADRNKRGWRVAALDVTEQAIKAVDDGCEEADR